MKKMSGMEVKFRRAIREDVPEIVRLLAEDVLGSKREQYAEPLSERYYQAFNEINSDKNNYLVVAEVEGTIIGTF
jgi:hypothetical protein